MAGPLDIDSWDIQDYYPHADTFLPDPSSNVHDPLFENNSLFETLFSAPGSNFDDAAQQAPSPLKPALPCHSSNVTDYNAPTDETPLAPSDIDQAIEGGLDLRFWNELTSDGKGCKDLDEPGFSGVSFYYLKEPTTSVGFLRRLMN